MQPDQYTITNDFSEDEANLASGRGTVDTSAIDAEFLNIAVSLNQTIDNIGLIQRDDGKLRDGLVEVYNLSQELITAFESDINIRGDWVTATAYAIKDLVNVDGLTYLGVVAHTSGATFAADLAAGKWMLFAAPVAALLDLAVARDGSNSPTANLPMGGFRHTGAGSPSAVDMYMRVADVRNQGATWVGVFGGGGANTLTATPAIPVAAYVAGLRICGITPLTNTSPTVTVNLSGLGSQTLTKWGAMPLQIGNLVANSVVSFTHDGLRFQLDNPGSQPMELLNFASVTTAAFLDFQNLSTRYFKYVFEYSNLLSNVNGNTLLMLTSVNNGSSYSVRASDYRNVNFSGNVGSGGGVTDGLSNSLLVGGSSTISISATTVGQPAAGVVEILEPANASVRTIIHGRAGYYGTDSRLAFSNMDGHRLVSEANNAIRFQFNSGLLQSMNYRLYGFR